MTWQCELCTFTNDDAIRACEMCGTPKGDSTLSGLQAQAYAQAGDAGSPTVVTDVKEDETQIGLYNTSTGNPVKVPLQKVSITGNVRQVSAQITLEQSYFNEEDTGIEAKYIFPVDDKAAICGFKAEINGKVINGEVQGKTKARETYDTALSQGHGAYLLEQKAKNQFEISVGNIPPKTAVVISITFCMELEYVSKKIRCTLPGAMVLYIYIYSLYKISS